MLAKAQRLFHTVRHLRPVQVAARLAAPFRQLQPDLSPAPPLRTTQGRWSLDRWRRPAMLTPNRFRFLNETREINFPADWARRDWPKLWLYNLHYLDDLDAIGAGASNASREALIARWIAENPPAEGPGWEPYCLSLRIVNLCRFAWRGNCLAADQVHSLAVQLRALGRQIEYHLLGNHIWANAKALLIGGLFFDGPEAQAWMREGARLLQRELPEQVLRDGGHFERSPMYHLILTSDLADILEADRISSGALPPWFSAEVRAGFEKMLSWAETMTAADGGPPFFNDATFGVAPSYGLLSRQAAQLGVRTKELSAPLVHLRESGFVRAEAGGARLFCDVGEVGPAYQPGHAHADTLSCELSIGVRRILVNSGVSTYDVSPERLWERGTAAHNTVVVDGQSSSDVWSSFRVAQRARPLEVHAERDGESLFITATHDGYRRLPGRVLHCRTWRLKPAGLEVTDSLSGHPRSAEAYWHFHPDIAVTQLQPDRFLCKWDAGSLDVSFIGGEVVQDQGYWAPEFGVRIPNQVLRVRMLGGELLSRWSW